MSDQFVAEIRIVGFNFAPTGWATCDGQLLPISQNTALFSLLGSFYGGDGKSTFALPNFRDSASMNQGQGAGLSDRFLGETGGSPSITLIQSEMPAHSHGLQARPVPGNSTIAGPTSSLAQANPATNRVYKQSAFGSITNMSVQSTGIAGSSFPHNNMQPYLTLYFNIALQGVFPPR
jgi:microcystin-dependent protein